MFELCEKNRKLNVLSIFSFFSQFMRWICICRHEVKALKSASATTANFASSNSKERLTIDWFTQAIAEIRGELAELQEASSNTSRHLQQRNQCAEDIVELRDDFTKLKLEFGAMRMRQETIDQAINELQAETIQRDEDFRHSQSHVSYNFKPFLHSFILCKIRSKTIRWRRRRIDGMQLSIVDSQIITFQIK